MKNTKHNGLALKLTLSLLISFINSANAQSTAGSMPPPPSALNSMVSAESIEQQGAKNYSEIMIKARDDRSLVAPDQAVFKRVKLISNKLIEQAKMINPRSKSWEWYVNVIRSEQANAFCLPGGKIAVYTGIIDKLALTDDELAAIIAHEMAHAVQEHAREQAAKENLTGTLVSLGSQALGLGEIGKLAISAGAGLLNLRFSRDDENDADIVGLHISSKSGYDPRAAIVLWRKMNTLNGSGSFQWLSTHPLSTNRITNIEKQLPFIMPNFSSIEAKKASLPYLSNVKGIDGVPSLNPATPIKSNAKTTSKIVKNNNK
jgi:predicted Zn-dependent protease